MVKPQLTSMVQDYALWALFSAPHFPLKWVHGLSHNVENQTVISQLSPIIQCLALGCRKGNTSTKIIPTVLYRVTQTSSEQISGSAQGMCQISKISVPRITCMAPTELKRLPGDHCTTMAVLLPAWH